MKVLAFVLALILPASAVAGEPTDRPDEDAVFGGDDGKKDKPATDRPDEDAVFGGDETKPGDRPNEDDVFGGGDGPSKSRDDSSDTTISEEEDDPLAIGGQVYVRLMSYIASEGPFTEQSLRMPNLVDLYLDARPDPRVRAFFNGRLQADPTIKKGAKDMYGGEMDAFDVMIDQLWIKTDIAHMVYLTLGMQRIKWGASRLWNPTDFLNADKLDSLAVFDERTGVTALKVHVPIESLGWNLYAFGLFDGLDAIEDVGGGVRAEIVFETVEMSLSAAFGKGRRTSLGVDISAGIWDLDIHAEVGFTNEANRTRYTHTGPLDLTAFLAPKTRELDNWFVRVSGGLDYSFKPNDDDVITIGAEYFYNPLGYSDPKIYPLLFANGAAEPFYMGQHYGALFVMYPSPGNWDEASFMLSNIGNLSDLTFASRLDFSVLLHTKLRLEVYVQGHYGKCGGELKFKLDIPEELTVPGFELQSIAAPLLLMGVNMRLSI